MWADPRGVVVQVSPGAYISWTSCPTVQFGDATIPFDSLIESVLCRVSVLHFFRSFTLIYSSSCGLHSFSSPAHRSRPLVFASTVILLLRPLLPLQSKLRWKLQASLWLTLRLCLRLHPRRQLPHLQLHRLFLQPRLRQRLRQLLWWNLQLSLLSYPPSHQLRRRRLLRRLLWLKPQRHPRWSPQSHLRPPLQPPPPRHRRQPLMQLRAAFCSLVSVSPVLNSELVTFRVLRAPTTLSPTPLPSM